MIVEARKFKTKCSIFRIFAKKVAGYISLLGLVEKWSVVDFSPRVGETWKVF